MRTRSSRRGRWCVAAVAACCVSALALPCRADDPLEDYRDRFQQGLDRYRAGDIHGAVQYWEAIRRELGEQVAYRLLFNLGKAYEALGDATLAAERYDAFLWQLERQKPDDVEDAVRDNGQTARQRLEELNATRGRIRVLPSETPGLVQVDLGQPRLGPFRAYVAPGKHTVTIDRGTSVERTIELTLDPGQEVVVDPTRPKQEPPVPPPVVQAPAPPPISSLPPPHPPAPSPAEPPFPAYVLYVSAGATVASFAVPWLAYRHADAIADDYEDPGTSVGRRRELADDYDAARTLYHASWLVPVVFAGATGALTLWYLEGGEPAMHVEAGATNEGGAVRVRGNF